jgi:hypothetical protein
VSEAVFILLEFRSPSRRIFIGSHSLPPSLVALSVLQIQANVNRAQRRAEEQRQAVPPCARDLRFRFEEAGLPTFNRPQANLGAVLARLQQANPSPEANIAMAYVRVAMTLVEERSTTSKSATSTSS